MIDYCLSFLDNRIIFCFNKIMKDSMQYQTSYFIDRSWQKINPNKQLSLNMSKAKDFIQLLIYEQSKINSLTHANPQHSNIKETQQKIHRFILEYIQQKQLHNSSKKQVSFIKQSSHRFQLRDCLEIWRWITEDNQNFEKNREIHIEDDSMGMNQFDNKNYSPIALKPNQAGHHKNSKSSNALYGLSLEDQQAIMKKSLEMVYMYQHQFKIIYNHYSKFKTEKQHQKMHTFDDVNQTLEILTIHRYMLFCRQFDIIKTLEFKKKNQHNFSINKHILLDIFKKCAHLQKYMNFEGFLVSLVNIAIKINQNFDLRSYMHIQLFLNSLKVRYYEQFIKKINQLNIKYTPTQFYNCYKNILKKVISKRKKQENPNPTLFNNPYFQQYERSTVFQKEKTVSDRLEQNNLQSVSPSKESMIRSSHSVPNLRKVDYKKNLQPNKEFHNDKRNIALPALPSLQENKYFKPIEANKQNNYSQYLDKNKLNQNPLSVFKNRITGYTNINSLKNKPFHMVDNPQGLSSNVSAFIVERAEKNIKNVVEGNNYQKDNAPQNIPLNKEQNSKPKQEQKIVQAAQIYQVIIKPSSKASKSSKVENIVPLTKQTQTHKEKHIIPEKNTQVKEPQQINTQKSSYVKETQEKQEKQIENIQDTFNEKNHIQKAEKIQAIESPKKKTASPTVVSKQVQKNTKEIQSPQKSVRKTEDNKKGKQILKLPSLVKGNIDQKQQRQMMTNIKKKLQVKDDDELLNQHLEVEQEKEKQVNGRLIQVFKAYNFNDE